MDDLERGLAFEAAVPMMSIVEVFKVLGLRAEVAISTKPLGSEEPSIIGVIKALHSPITPRFSDRDKDHFDPPKKTKPDYNSEGARITIASPKTECVVDLEKVGDTHGFPAANQALSHRIVVFSPLGV